MESHAFSDEPAYLNEPCQGIEGTGCNSSSSSNRVKCKNCWICRKC